MSLTSKDLRSSFILAKVERLLLSVRGVSRVTVYSLLPCVNYVRANPKKFVNSHFYALVDWTFRQDEITCVVGK